MNETASTTTNHPTATHTDSVNILVVGSGGREHAMAWKLAQSPLAENIYVAPGNGGTALLSTVENISTVKHVNISVTDIAALIQFATEHAIGLCVVGPEAPLAAGIRDQMDQAGIPCIGPTQAAAQLESSKTFCKNFLNRHLIPTAPYACFTQLGEAELYLQNTQGPWVIKADGLAAGKGVVICQDLEHAKSTLKDMMQDAKFGSAGHQVVIEAFIQGEEASFIYLVDKGRILPLATSQDHKARDDGDTGPNTGGMGAYSPAKLSADFEQRVMEEVIRPTVLGMAEEGIPYSGFLYAGIMVSEDGDPYVLEFNCRLGDPETQPILMRLQSDLVSVFLKMAQGKLQDVSLDWDDRPALGVVMAAGGYPGDYSKGHTISGLDTFQPDNPSLQVFHAGTAVEYDEHEAMQVTTQGGRVLCVCALGDDLRDAQSKAYQACQQITWTDCFYRKDIGFKGIDS